MSDPGPAVHDLVLVRHGQTEWSRFGKHTGRTDIELTDHGRKQAESLGRMLEKVRFAAVFVSPLTRAHETMKLAGLTGTTLADLAEWDYGDYEGRRTIEIRKTIPGWSVWTHPIPGGESVGAVGARMDRVIARATSVDGPVALFGHAHALRILGARWIGLSPEAGRLLSLHTASVSVLGWEREQRVIKGWNELGQPFSEDPIL